MALREIKEKVLKMRRAGMSYSQIRAEVMVSKGTLSLWLRDLPLTRERINALRANSPQRIERCRNTKASKRDARLRDVYQKAALNIGKLGDLSEREIFLCGLFLYWGEGSKTNSYCIEITNTDPAMIKFALLWFKTMGVEKESLKARIKIYGDTDKEETVKYWCGILGFVRSQFRFQIKKTNQADITYKTGFGHCTCSLIYWNRDKGEHIAQSLRYIRNLFL